MNAKQKRREVNLYQFSVYTPVLKRVKRNEDNTYTLEGITYPYRKKEFDLRWLEAFHPQNSRRDYWDGSNNKTRKQ